MEESSNEILINCVRSFECLWNMKSRDYSDVGLRNTAWLEVSRVLNKPVDFCKTRWKRWKSLRDKYTRVLKDEKVSQRSGSCASFKTEWAHKQQMEFLRGIVTPRHQTDSWYTAASTASQAGGESLPIVVTVSTADDQDSLDAAFETPVMEAEFSAVHSQSPMAPPDSPLARPFLSLTQPSNSKTSKCSSGSSLSNVVTSTKKRRRDEEVDAAFIQFCQKTSSMENPKPAARRESTATENFFQSVAQESEQLTAVRRLKLRRSVDDALLALLVEQEEERASNQV